MTTFDEDDDYELGSDPVGEMLKGCGVFVVAVALASAFFAIVIAILKNVE